jgi:hypothetical protein
VETFGGFVIPDLWHHLVCLMLGHSTISYGPGLWLVLAETGWVPANRAFCRRCRWRGYRTTWGTLVARGQAPAE